MKKVSSHDKLRDQTNKESRKELKKSLEDAKLETAAEQSEAALGKDEPT